MQWRREEHPALGIKPNAIARIRDVIRSFVEHPAWHAFVIDLDQELTVIFPDCRSHASPRRLVDPSRRGIINALGCVAGSAVEMNQKQSGKQRMGFRFIRLGWLLAFLPAAMAAAADNTGRRLS